MHTVSCKEVLLLVLIFLFTFIISLKKMWDYYLNLGSWPAEAPFATSGVSVFTNPLFMDNHSLPSNDSQLRNVFGYYYLLFRNSFYLVWVLLIVC